VSAFDPDTYDPSYFEEDDTLEFAQQTLLSSLELAAGEVDELDQNSFDSIDKLKEIIKSAKSINELKEVDHVLVTSLNS